MVMLESSAAVAVQIPSRNFNRPLSHCCGLFIPRRAVAGLRETYCGKRYGRDNRVIRASAKEQFSSKGSEQLKQSSKPMRYHPSEDIVEPELMEGGEARLTPAETSRTIIEVNSKATLMFTGLVSNEAHENIFWPDLPYITDEHGNIYFQVMNEEDILKTLATEENLLQVFIGLDTAEVITEMQSSGQIGIDFGIDEFDNEDIGINDEDYDEDEDDDVNDNDYEEGWVAVLDQEEDTDDDSEGSLGDWAKLETMRSSHPMYFSRRLSEVVNDDPIDFMEQSPVGLVIQGIVRPAFLEEHTVIQKQISDSRTIDADWSHIAESADCNETTIVPINIHRQNSGSDQDDPKCTEKLEKDENLGNGTSFYKLEVVKIHFISSHGHQTCIEIEDFQRAQPDAIAQPAVKILSRLKAGGQKTIQALKSLCMRCKGIQVEEVALIGMDSLGIDVRVCSGIQVQTLRFPFKKRASSEYSAERQLNNLLFPRLQKMQRRKEAQQTES
ncbi:unnamed protein product [Cuscuta epithymum]|uniref:Pentatricopeptide repeat superfamily protein n=1 Tax=Cuscuta epithymum TaxID=186058 RepID=A0AAV0C956_9ASTE|nr:unnamed protein product [Cuscuta epithymum]